jgi:hypothetical protein
MDPSTEHGCQAAAKVQSVDDLDIRVCGCEACEEEVEHERRLYITSGTPRFGKTKRVRTERPTVRMESIVKEVYKSLSHNNGGNVYSNNPHELFRC